MLRERRSHYAPYIFVCSVHGHVRCSKAWTCASQETLNFLEWKDNNKTYNFHLDQINCILLEMRACLDIDKHWVVCVQYIPKILIALQRLSNDIRVCTIQSLLNYFVDKCLFTNYYHPLAQNKLIFFGGILAKKVLQSVQSLARLVSCSSCSIL